MKLAVRVILTLLVTTALVPLACPAQALADSKTTSAVQVTVTVPVMIQVPQSMANQVLPPITNQGSSLTQEWRLSPEGRNVRLYTSVVR